MFLALSELIGPKRAAWCVYTGKGISAEEALRVGLVSEVLPETELLARAHELAKTVLQRPRHARRMTHAILTRHWQRQVVDGLREQYAQQLLTAR